LDERKIGTVIRTERRLADAFGFVLIFDEVKTGFRHALGGYQAISGVTGDLSTWAKAAANGYPISILGGRRQIMDLVDDPDPARRVMIAGTYNAHPLPVAAAVATIELLAADDGAGGFGLLHLLHGPCPGRLA